MSPCACETGSAGREGLKSRLGFLMVAAGCAVGLGNVWRFPFIVGRNGGAAFVLVYLVFLALLGFPLLTAELAVGRAARKGISGAMRALAPERTRKFWYVLGCIVFGGNLLLMAYYTSVGGWLMRYTAGFAAEGSAFTGTGAKAAFDGLLSDPATCTAYMLLAVVVAAGVCLAGVQRGVERVTKWMMLSLLALLGVLAVKALSLPGAMKGVEFYLAPNWTPLIEHPFRTCFDAMGQAFFTLSVGVGCMTIFGSYVGREHSLVTESLWITAIDTCVAFLAGLVVFPARAPGGVRAHGRRTAMGSGVLPVSLACGANNDRCSVRVLDRRVDGRTPLETRTGVPAGRGGCRGVVPARVARVRHSPPRRRWTWCIRTWTWGFWTSSTWTTSHTRSSPACPTHTYLRTYAT